MECRTMKILVFDDSQIHRDSAKLTLADHDLTVVGTYDEAQKALVPEVSWEKRNKILPELLLEAGFAKGFEPYGKDKDASAEKKKKYAKVQTEAREHATTYPDFDVVLTDLLVPASRQAQGGEGEKLVGKEMPLGTTIALLALMVGVKNVAVVTDTNHHHHPASAAFDCFGDCRIPGINILCTNSVSYTWVDKKTGKFINQRYRGTKECLEKYPDLTALKQTQGKDWEQVLWDLLNPNTD